MADLTGQDTSAKRYFLEQYLNRVYFQNGKNRSQHYDRAAWYRTGIQDFPFVPTVADAAAAGNLLGEYAYFVAPVNSRYRNGFGQRKAGLPSCQSARITVANSKVTISAIPSTHPDPQVDFYFIYRCKADTLDADTATEDLDFFYVGRVAVGTTSFTDNVSDDELDDAERVRFNTNIPPCCNLLAQFGERMFTAGFDTITTGAATKASKTISAIAKTNQIVSVSATGHGYSVGDFVSITLTTPDLRLEGTKYIRSTPDANTFTYHEEGADIASGNGGTAEKITFSLAIPEGVLGAKFQKIGEGTTYTVGGLNSTTNVALDRAFSGTLSASTYRIFRNPWEIYYSEFKDADAWGSAGEFLRNRLDVPGKEEVRALIAWNGQLLVFTTQNIYAIQTNGSKPTITQDPVYAGYGCVGPRAVWVEGEDLFFVTTQGVYMLRPGGGPQPVGDRLNKDWLDVLNSAEQDLIVVSSNGQKLYVDYPVAGDTQCSKCWRYERTLDQWYPELGPADFAYRDDGDGGIQGQCYVVIGREVWQRDYDDVDGPGEYSGAITSSTTTSATNTGATFPTSDGGLENCLVRFYRTTSKGVETLVGVRKITSNSGTQVSWGATGELGGSLTLAADDRYEIGNIPWSWKTKTFEQSGHGTKLMRLIAGVHTKNSNQFIRMQKYVNGAAAGYREKLANRRLYEAWDVNDNCDDFAAEFSSRDGAVLRTVIVQGEAQKK